MLQITTCLERKGAEIKEAHLQDLNPPYVATQPAWYNVMEALKYDKGKSWFNSKSKIPLIAILELTNVSFCHSWDCF